jgi:hypothetical protein
MFTYGPFSFGGVMAHIVWHEEGFAGIDRAVVDFMKDLGERVMHAAQGLAPVDTGELKSSIRLDMQGKTAIISANTHYAVYQEEGTGPHVMDDGPYYWPGASHPVDVIHHPGNPAVHYLKNALYSAGA